MSKFTKYVLPTALFFILIALISPYMIGGVIEKDYVEFQNSLPHNADVAFRIENFQRGWFSSRADLVMDFVQTKQGSVSKPGPAQHIKFSNTIYHGPFIIAPKATGSTIRFAKAFILSSVSHPKDIPLNMKTTVAFGDKVMTRALADEITYKFETPQGTTMVLQGMEADFQARSGTKHILTLSLNAFDMFDQGTGHIRAKNIHHDSDFSKGLHDFWSGHANTRIADFDLDTAENYKLEVQGLELQQHSSLEDTRGQGEMSLTIHSVKWNSQDYGQQTIKISARRLDVDTLQKFTEAFEEQQKQGMPLLPFGKSFRNALAFFSKGLELSLDTLDVNTQWGRVHANATVSLPESQTNLGTLHDVMLALKASAHFKLPNDVAKNLLIGYLIATAPEAEQTNVTPEQAQAMLKSWVDEGWIQQTADNVFLVDIKVENGAVLVNDKPFDLTTPPQNTITNAPQAATPTPITATQP